MNYFGMFFSYMIPGIVIGLVAAAAYVERSKEKRHKSKNGVKAASTSRVKTHTQAAGTAVSASPAIQSSCNAVEDKKVERRNKLFVCTLAEDAA